MIITDPEYNVSKKNNSFVKYFWQSWTIVKFTQNEQAWMSKDGHFHDGKYGYVRLIEPNEKGEWRI